ncbi:MAG: hypothetical protein JXR37_19265 [Kiritimatiellae bacterium]|nr:hypothetical protein [Kiritimatiellia bacterium]
MADKRIVPAQKAKALLDLARTDRRLAETEFNSLEFDEQLELVRAVRPESKKDLLFLAEDCTRLVKALPEDDHYQTVRSGTDIESIILLELGTGVQMNYLLDLECWRGREIDQARFSKWMEFLIECDDQLAGRAMAEIDSCFMAAALDARMRVVGITEEELRLNEDMKVPYMFTPDDLECDDDLTAQFVELLCAIDNAYFCEVCKRLVLDLDVESDAYAAHVQRMSDAQIPSAEEAAQVYRKIALSRPADPERVADTAHLVRAEQGVPFFHRVMESRAKRGDTAATAGMNEGLVALFNLVAAADGVETPDVMRRDAVAKAGAYLSLGLEWLSNGDPETADRLFEPDGLLDLFRAGYTLASGLREQAVKVLSDPRLVRERGLVSCFEPRERTVLALACRAPPRRILPDESSRIIQTLGDLKAAQSELRNAAFVVELTCRLLPLTLENVLKLDPDSRHPADPGVIRLGMVLIANIENALAGAGEADFRLQRLQTRAEWAGKWVKGGRIRDSTRNEASEWLENYLAKRRCSEVERAVADSFLHAQIETWAHDLAYLAGAHGAGEKAVLERLSTLTCRRRVVNGA